VAKRTAVRKTCALGGRKAVPGGREKRRGKVFAGGYPKGSKPRGESDKKDTKGRVVVEDRFKETV